MMLIALACCMQEVLMHLTCTNLSEEKIKQALNEVHSTASPLSRAVRSCLTPMRLCLVVRLDRRVRPAFRTSWR